MNFQYKEAVFLLSIAMLVQACQVDRTQDPRPNIIVILADDAGYADFGFMGSEDLQTPNLDLLARQGIVFTDAHTSASVCAPSRAGLITGNYQQRFGFECNGVGDTLGLPLDEKTIAQALKEEGYKTIAIGKWHLGKEDHYHPNERGFEEFYGFLSGSRSYFPKEKIDQPGHPSAILSNRQQVSFEGYLTDAFGDQAVEYIDRFKNYPFFMYLSFNAVHTPMEAKEEDLARFEGHTRAPLAAMTWSMDENIGKVVQKLSAENLFENTLIFFLSDNGGATNNQSSVGPLKGWKGNKFEGGHRVPMILCWPEGVPGGQAFDGLTSALDIFPTTLMAAGGEEANTDGVNLLPFLKGEKPGDPHQTLFWRKDQMAAARSGDYKLIRLNGFGNRLYNLEQDLGENNDLIEEERGMYMSIKSELDKWEETLLSPMWLEGQAWNKVTFEIHRALMENESPKYLNPQEMKEVIDNLKVVQ